MKVTERNEAENQAGYTSEKVESGTGSVDIIPPKSTVGVKSEVTHRGYKGGSVHEIGNTEKVETPKGL